MSRIGNKIITIPKEVEVTIDENNNVVAKGPKGTLTNKFSKLLTITNENNEIRITRANEEKHTKQLHGTTRALINGMVVGVSEGFKKELKIQGIGYRARMEGNDLVLSVGFSHPVTVKPIEGVTIEVPKNNSIIISGINKQVVGQMAATIRSVRKPEPYGGKGIMYVDERIIRKVGKKAGKS
ncbi:TPA: 50S ribosomal protein L6 [bacterium]|nr:50S ribosomal protein L6 [bacterium]